MSDTKSDRCVSIARKLYTDRLQSTALAWFIRGFQVEDRFIRSRRRRGQYIFGGEASARGDSMNTVVCALFLVLCSWSVEAQYSYGPYTGGGMF